MPNCRGVSRSSRVTNPSFLRTPSTRVRVVDTYLLNESSGRSLRGDVGRTSNPATFSTSRRAGAVPRSERTGSTLSIKCRKDCARGSEAPFAFGLSTVYGWHAGDKSQRFALSGSSDSAFSVLMSTCDPKLNSQQMKTRRAGAKFSLERTRTLCAMPGPWFAV